MVWRNTRLEEQKRRFVRDWLKREFYFSELCDFYGISRKTGYKIIHRFQDEGNKAFESRSSARHSIENKTPAKIEKQIVELKLKFPSFGPIKLRIWLNRNKPSIHWPAASTIGDILKKHGLVRKRKYRQKIPPYTKPFKSCSRANKVWSADFKGQFRLGNGQYCYPLTITDNYSRFLLTCEGLYRPTLENTHYYFEKAFCQYGLPDAIKTDNGLPFAGSGIAGLSRLSIWWLKLGIIPERIKAGCPAQNGRHERMHRTLKSATINPAQRNLVKQQEQFKAFVQVYNFERPHEALKNKVPGEIYTNSNRKYPRRLPDMSYPTRFEIRQVRSNGEIKLGGNKYYITEMLHGEPIGLKKIEEDMYEIYYSKLKLGIIDNKVGELIRK